MPQYKYKPLKRVESQQLSAEVTITHIVTGCGNCPFAVTYKSNDSSNVGICSNLNRHPALDITITRAMLLQPWLPSGCPMRTVGEMEV